MRRNAERGALLLLYNEVFLAQPVQLWKISVHALERVDMMTTLGEVLTTNKSIRGTQAARSVRLFSSNAIELEVAPRGSFMLMANVLNEIGLTLRAQYTGTARYFVNVVDMEFRHLLRSFMVVAKVDPPHITKAFEVQLTPGQTASKRVPMSNPRPSERKYQLLSARPDLLSFKEDLLVVPAGAAANIGLRFKASAVPGVHTVLVFVNDTDGKNEECMSIKVVVA